MMLLQAAANEWKVPVEQCKADKGVITGPGNRKTTFARLPVAASQLGAGKAHAQGPEGLEDRGKRSSGSVPPTR